VVKWISWQEKNLWLKLGDSRVSPSQVDISVAPDRTQNFELKIPALKCNLSKAQLYMCICIHCIHKRGVGSYIRALCRLTAFTKNLYPGDQKVMNISMSKFSKKTIENP